MTSNSLRLHLGAVDNSRRNLMAIGLEEQLSGSGEGMLMANTVLRWKELSFHSIVGVVHAVPH